MSEQEAQKRKAAERAVALVEDGMKLGLGTGSTARHVLQVIAERRARGELPNIIGVATSNATQNLAYELDIPMTTLDEQPELDLGIDGADEVDRDLNLIKGLGGALLWEKIVASACRQFVVVVDESKLVEKLGARAPLPVEVVPFAWRTHLRAFERLGADPALRQNSDGSVFVTDSSHYIIDCRFEAGLDNPHELEAELKMRAGVIETGLFLDMTTAVIVAGVSGLRLLER